jgi:hypothetical protein
MFEAYFSADDFKNICGDLEMLIAAFALVWACRRDLRSSEKGQNPSFSLQPSDARRGVVGLS